MTLWRDLLAGLALAWLGLMPGAQAQLDDVQCGGALLQGGLLICEGAPDMDVAFNGHARTLGPDGIAVFGLRRDEPSPASVRVTDPQGKTRLLTHQIASRSDDFRTIEGLDCDKVDARSQEQKDHAGRSWVTKQNGFSRFHTGPGARDGFIVPSEGPPSSPFGPTRRYIGVSAVTGEPCDRTSVHRGYDIATPVGTPIIAPASGTVTLADGDLYYEGGTVFLDHGHGLLSVFMHMSAVEVEVGQVVAQGERLGKTGNTGRTTGPHLHWAVKWRDIASDDRAGDFYIDPALLLDLPRRDDLPGSAATAR